jgi:hypothetical protein
VVGPVSVPDRARWFDDLEQHEPVAAPVRHAFQKRDPNDRATRDLRAGNRRRTRHRRRVWDYPENSAQFNGLSDGASVPVLVDPRDPNIVYTVRDVEQRTNTRGFALTGLVFIVPGVLGLVAMGWFALRFVPRANRRDTG